MNRAEKALQYFIIAVPEDKEQAEAYFWARRALNAAIRAEKMDGKPASIDREAWTGCVCNNGKKNCCTCISLECHACIRESKYRQGRYCSACGRPLTEEAWAELEKRIGGTK